MSVAPIWKQYWCCLLPSLLRWPSPPIVFCTGSCGMSWCSGAGAILMTLSRAAVVAWLILVAVFALVWWLKSSESRANFPHASLAMDNQPRLSRLDRTHSAGGTVDPAARKTRYVQVRPVGAHGPLARDCRSDALGRIARLPWHGARQLPAPDYLAYAWTELFQGTDSSAMRFPDGVFSPHRRPRDVHRPTCSREPGSELRVRGQVRSPQSGAKLSVGLCENRF